LGHNSLSPKRHFANLLYPAAFVSQKGVFEKDLSGQRPKNINGQRGESFAEIIPKFDASHHCKIIYTPYLYAVIAVTPSRSNRFTPYKTYNIS